jgi:AraC-like DNA-binding protein
MSSTRTKIIEDYRIPSYIVRLLFDYLEERGIDAQALLRTPRPGRYGVGSYSRDDWRSMLERAQQHLNDPELGLHLGQGVAIAHFGLLGYLMFNSSSLGDVLARGGKYFRLLHFKPIRMVTSMEADSVTVDFQVHPEQQVGVSDEAILTAVVQLARSMTDQPLRLQEMSFVHAGPQDQNAYDEYFGCPVKFGQPVIRMRFPLSYLRLKLRTPDPDLAVLLENQANSLLAELPGNADLAQMVRDCISGVIRLTEPTVEQVAELLHVSPRTLQRRLDEANLNFRSLLDDTRRQLAENYLLDPALRLKEVAYKLGFSEQSAFTRAFRRWTGNSPREFLKNRLDGK